MNKILEAIKDAITGPMTEMNIIVDSVKYETEGNYNLYFGKYRGQAFVVSFEIAFFDQTVG